ncbi:hypothetical protein PHBOTO_004634 [Pseudozyma hubeiensis]|nr:hypothetical protein PHBOTO_004634 [Pseudozyma hubeiensis]
MSDPSNSSSGALAGAPPASQTKYASLPDVDTSAPDVYEYQGPNRDPTRLGRQRSRQQRSDGQDTDSNSSSDDSDRSANRKHAGGGKAGGSDDIDGSSLRRNDAAAKFDGATALDVDRADFSGRLHGRRRGTRKTVGTRPRDAGLETTTYSLDGEAAKGAESVVDRLRRLKFEASQLEEELNAAAAASSNGEDATKNEARTQVGEKAEVLDQLKLLQEQLAKLPTSHNETVDESQADKATIRALLQQVKQSSTTSKAAATSSVSAASGASTSTADMVQLEARLSELESTLGLEEALLDESKPVPRPVLSTLSRLEHQLSLLSQPRHLDAISRRVKVLVTELDRVHDVRRKLGTNVEATKPTDSSSTLTPAELTKLQQLFDVSTRLEPLLPIVPSVLTRLQTLSELHSSASHFASTLQELEEANEDRQHQDEQVDALLQKMEVNMEQNRKTVEANLSSLQSRIEDVAGRLEKVKR